MLFSEGALKAVYFEGTRMWLQKRPVFCFRHGRTNPILRGDPANMVARFTQSSELQAPPRQIKVCLRGTNQYQQLLIHHRKSGGGGGKYLIHSCYAMAPRQLVPLPHWRLLSFSPRTPVQDNVYFRQDLCIFNWHLNKTSLLMNVFHPLLSDSEQYTVF